MYYFFDETIIEYKRNIKNKVYPAKKDKKILFTEGWLEYCEHNYELRLDNSYPNVLFDKEENLYKCYYTAIIYDPCSSQHDLKTRKNSIYQPTNERKTALLLATSKDGENWQKPNLGLVEYNNSNNNNILILDAHGASVFIDEHEINPNRRYKFIYKNDQNMKMVVAFSKDGYQINETHSWDDPKIQGDAHNFAYYDKQNNMYYLITRQWAGLRIVSKCQSKDFINWSSPIPIVYGQNANEQIYSMPVWNISDDLYLGLASIYHDGDSIFEEYDAVDLELFYSRGGDVYFKLDSEDKLIDRGSGKYGNGEADNGCIYASIPCQAPNSDLHLYYMGGNGRHTNFRETSLLRAKINKNKLVCTTQKFKEQLASLYTRPISKENNETIKLKLYANIDRDGLIEIQLCDTRKNYYIDQNAIDDNCKITLDHSSKQTDDYYDIQFTNLGNLKEKFVINFRFKEAELFCFETNCTIHIKKNDI